MRRILFFLFCIPIFAYSQTDIIKEYAVADSLIRNDKIEEAYPMLKQLEQQVSSADTLYNYIMWYQIQIATHLENRYRMAEDFELSRKYGLEALGLIEKGTKIFHGSFGDREAFMIKNLVVSNFGLKRYGEAQQYKDMLYKVYKEAWLPKGIDDYFNFDYFKWEDKNIWGYEWYQELPKDRFSSSFSKVVYYVYSTNPDGSDKEQLYRLHVLMFHGADMPFDYVMTKQLETSKNEASGTLYAYTYKENIDFEKLHNDVIEILKGNLQPDTKRTISKQEDGTVKASVELSKP
ncbi:MAG: hypothetical protein ACK5M3_09125 [Dysgonomonas sp.]